ncbi:PREDICTED: meiotic recombination protein SPO11-2 isoform X3 [Nelumbo nucifera]|uniref:Meiotic recombination protein SPO11-2 isoform X3 n=1 Tax=Nelumbo nucifera TaxID=4432 RepID=A0A1U8AG32_NELNU|nr:PREDICTED: meiotic recombination protein SPO11-2 isoform X3 [Nelumbo nucifera]
MEDFCKSSLFYSDQHLCYAEILPPSEVRARIEVAVLNFLRTLISPNPSISSLPLYGKLWKSALSFWFMRRRSLRGSSFTSCFVVLQITSLLSCKLTKPSKVNAPLDMVCLAIFPVGFLFLSRYSLGIMASSRGALIGRLFLQEPNQEIVDCSTCGSSGHAITGDLNSLENLVIKSDARYIIVVEKHAIFQRLAEDRIFNQIPSIIITAKGYPDIATRVLLHRLTRALPDLPIFALVDWNPSGLAILCTFKFGSITMGLEAYKYACNVRWLGMRGCDLHLIPEQSFIPLKPWDLQIAQSLMSSEMLQENYREELTLMVQSGQRAEIESLHFHGYDFLGKYIATKIVQSDYI